MYIRGTYTGSTCTYTRSTRFKLPSVIKLTCCSNVAGIRSTMVPIENSHGFVTNIKSSSSSNIPKWKA
jgi:hypothetical protein